MQVFVGSKNQAHDLVKRHDASHLVSILDPGDRLFLTPRLREIQRLHQFFEDVLDEQALNAPTRQHVQELLDWGSQLPQDAVVVVHCFAGISRSTAAALALLVQHHGDVEVAAEKLLEVRPVACPNPIISKFADEILGMNGNLFARSEEIANSKILKILQE